MDNTISSGVPLTNFNWNALVDKINSAAPGANIEKASFDSASGNVTFTVAENDGTTRDFSINIPDIDTPGVIDEAEFASLVAKLGSGDILGLTEGEMTAIKELYKEFADTPLPESTGNVMFDIYALLALMLEAAQKQRDAAREIRKTENQLIQNAIQNQAEAQRDAALTGMFATLAVSVVQIGLQAGAMVKSGMAHTKQMNAMKNAGIGEAQSKFDTAKTTLETETAKLNRMTQVKDAKANVTAKQQDLDAATARLAEKEGVVTQKTSDLEAAQQAYDSAPAADKAAAKTRLDQTKAELDAAVQDKTTAKAEVETATENLATARTLEEGANADYRNLGGDPAEVTDATIENQTQKVQDAKNDFNEADIALDKAERNLRADENYTQGRHTQEKWNRIGDIIAACGQAAQGIVRSAVDLQQADVTSMGAEQKKAEEGLDQIKDLFNQGQDVIKAVLSLFSAVLQAESASMRDAIHA